MSIEKIFIGLFWLCPLIFFLFGKYRYDLSTIISQITKIGFKEFSYILIGSLPFLYLLGSIFTIITCNFLETIRKTKYLKKYFYLPKAESAETVIYLSLPKEALLEIYRKGGYYYLFGNFFISFPFISAFLIYWIYKVGFAYYYLIIITIIAILFWVVILICFIDSFRCSFTFNKTVGSYYKKIADKQLVCDNEK